MRQMPRSVPVIVLLVVAFGLAACNSEPTCEKAAAHVLALIDKQNQEMLAKFPEGQRKQLADMVAKSLPEERLVEECKKSFTKEQIACTLAAKSLADASQCNQAADTAGSAPPAPTGENTAPAPTGETPPPAADNPPPAADNAPPAAGDSAEPAQPE